MCALSVQFYIPHMWYCLFYRDYSSFYLFVNFRCIILWWNYSFDYEYTHGDFKLFDKEIDLLTNPENNFVSDSKEDISSESEDGEVSDIIDD